MNEREIFSAALTNSDPDHRAAYLKEVCADDAGLRERVEALLAEHANLGSFLESPAVERPSSDADTSEIEALPSSESEMPLDFLLPSQQPRHLGRLGHYEVVEVIGRGGMGIVLRAIDNKLQRVVAIKVMAAQLATSAAARKRFMREAQAAAAVSHDHVVTIHAVEEAGGLPYLAMQYVSGVSLQQRLDKSGPLALREIVRIGMQTAAGLAAAHAQGLIHRDIKPANILLENGVERVKITDFGLARAVADASTTQTGMVAGTPQYMSPEQARGELVDRRSDLFSLGSVLYAMCTGRPPFRADSGIAVLRRVCEDTPRPIREISSDLPQWLEAIIGKLHAKDPAHRYQTAAEVAELLNNHLAHLQHPSVMQLPAMDDVEKSTRRAPVRRHFWATAAAVLICLIGGLGLTEAAGVTSFTASVIRLLTPAGTLIVEVDDPTVKVTIDGDGGLVITGVGQHEVRLKPGIHKLLADKNGKPFPLAEELVTITHGDKQIVKVSLEGASPVAAISPAEPQAFVVFGGKSVAERRYNSLAEAVHGASSGDTIEIRGNGPFVCEAIAIKGHAHTIRAGAGFRPVLQFSENLRTNSSLVLEGLEFQRRGETIPADWNGALIFSWDSSSLHIANCKFWDPLDLPTVFAHSRQTIVRNCLFLSPKRFSIACYLDSLCIVDNSLLIGRTGLALGEFGDRPQRENRVQLTRNTWSCISAVGMDATPTSFATASSKPANFDASENIFDTSAPFCHITGLADADIESLSAETIDAGLRSVLNWRDRMNIYTADHGSIAAYTQTTATAIGPTNLGEWNRFWGSSESTAVEGTIRYQGGNLMSKLNAAPEKLTPEDFRLRPDSAGYRAGKDGQDLGANVDLVGPGVAYERWKKTAEYQQWLEDTNQVKADSPRAERGAFVVLGGNGVTERKFDTLADAVLGASAGDTIEIRGNGPFVGQPVDIKNVALTVRAAPGFRPVIRLSAECEAEPFLLRTVTPLILEGLELQRTTHSSHDSGLWLTILQSDAQLYAANCRFLLQGLNTGIQVNSPELELRNCEFICTGDSSALTGECSPGQRWSIENCVQAGAGWALGYVTKDLNQVSIREAHSTLVHSRILCRETSDPPSGRPELAVRVEMSGNVFDNGDSHLRFEQSQADSLPEANAGAALRRIVAWRGSGNLYASNQLFLIVSDQWKELESSAPIKSLADWEQFWNGAEVGSLEGRIRYQGGDLLAKLCTSAEKLTPDDFRLRPDSAGYRAGPDGKDLGANIDLVGPGPGYERWKKTPEYQQWLEDSRRAK